MSPRRVLWLLSITLPSGLGAATVDDGLCRNGTFPNQNSFALGAIAGAGRAHFVDDMRGCPTLARKCRLKSYLIGGDRIVMGRKRGQFACVYYRSKGGGVAGWLPADRIRSLPVEQNPLLSSWIGRWSDEGNPVVRLSRRDSTLVIKGEAAWPSFNPPVERFPAGSNVGEIDEPLRRSGNRAYARECRITFTLLGDLMVAADPKMQCGGMNVSFAGVYRRMGR